jgi:uncharacterized protein
MILASYLIGSKLLYRLEIENFCSVKERQILDLSIAPNVPDEDGRYAPLFPGSAIRAPKAVAIYGANASGKTTVLKALDLIIAFVRYYPLRDAGGFTFDAFNDEASVAQPVKLAIELAGEMDLSPRIVSDGEVSIEHGIYRYELEFVRSDFGGYRVHREELARKPLGVGKWRRVFERNDTGTVKGPTSKLRSFPLAGYSKILDKLPPNVSVIATLAEFQHPQAMQLVEASARMSSNMKFGRDGQHDKSLVDFLAASPALVSTLNRDLRSIDLGLDAMRIEQTANGPLPMFLHDGHKIELPWALESDGTRAFIRMFPLIAAALESGGIVIMDEFDGLIHPLVLPEILNWFYSRSGRNELDAQIWFSCHAASLLDDLTKDEVVLCEKDHDGRTEIFRLVDVRDGKAVRRDENLYKKYLSGAYGAVPRIG